MIDAKHGRGCAHCEQGVSVAWFASGAGSFGLCVGCLLIWWPAKSAAWLEERMSLYRDHIDDRLVKALTSAGVPDLKPERITQPQTGDIRPGLTEKQRRALAPPAERA